MDWIRKNIELIVVVLLGFIPLIPLLHPGFPVTHDGQDQIARIANFYRSLSEGNIVPRWAANLNWGYGHPILMFLYPFPSYAASFFHFLGFSLVDSVKIVFGLAFILSGITMYLWIRNIFGEKAGVLSGILYMYAPYRFVDFYVRGDLGEHVSFVFAPLVFYFLYKLSKKNLYRYVAGGSFSVALLFLSHNALSLLFLPIAALYGLVLIWKAKYKKLLFVNYLLIAALGFGLASFFLIPAFFEGKYTLRDIVTGHSEYEQRFVAVLDFIKLSWSYGGTDYLSKQIGVVQIVGILLGTISLIATKNKKNIYLYFVLLFSFFMSLFMMLPYSNFIWSHISLIQKFQFPWRFLSVVVFVSPALSSFIFLNKKNQKRLLILTIILIAAAVIFYYPYYKANGYLEKPESFYTGVYPGTTDTGESSPVWSVRFMERAAPAPAEVIGGSATIKKLFSNTTTRKYLIDAKNGRARIRENTLYFPNWVVYVNGKTTNIEYQDPANRGLITYFVPKGENNVVIKFQNTKLRTFSEIITVLSFTALCLLFFLPKKILFTNK